MAEPARAAPGARPGQDFLAERMALAFAFNRRAALINGALALLVVWALGAATPLPQRLGWLAVVGLTLALRLLVGEARRRDPDADAHALRWGWRITVALGLSGLAWGGGAALLVDGSDPVREAFWVVALCGIGTGAVSGLRHFQPAIWGYLLPLLLPLVLRFSTSAAPVDRAIAGGLALFLVFSLIQGRSAARTLLESLAIRAENTRLVAELTARHADALAARRLAEDAAAAKARFFAAASHDLRQPMQALVLLDAALQQAAPAERPALQARLSEGVRTLDRLFEAILAVSALQARPADAVAPAALPLTDLAATLQARYGPQAEARGLRLLLRAGLHGQRSTLAVRGDAAALERLLGNLLANALRFTPHGGCVLLAWRGGVGGQPLRLQVRDNGCGIADADQQRVFEAFVQVGNAHRDRAAGTGLGLAIARRLAEDLGGALQLRSAPGRGSCFELRLPAPRVVAAEAPPAGAAGAGSADGHTAGHAGTAGAVWIIDDDPLVRGALAALLSGWGLVVRAVDHPDALPTDGPAPALLLCDRMLAGIDGLDAAQALQQRLQPPPRVVMLSGLRDDSARTVARTRGWVWLDKPVRPMALRACLAAPKHGMVQASASPSAAPWPSSPPP